MASGTNRDNPKLPFSNAVLTRWLEKLGFRRWPIDPDLDLPGLVPSSDGVTSTWVLQADGTWAAPSGGTSDHGALTGLSDDDHPQYVLTEAGAFSVLAPTSAVAASGSTELVRKGEMDTDLAGKISTGVAVTASSMVMTTARLLGRTTATDGAVEEVQIGNGLQMGSKNLELDDMANGTMKGRFTSGTGPPEDLTVDLILELLELQRAPYQEDSEAGAPVRSVGASTTSAFTLTDLTVPASTSTDWSAELVIEGLIYNSSGSTNPLRVKTTYGSTTMTNSKNSSQPTNDADPQPFRMAVRLSASGSTTAQHSTIEFWLASASSASSGYGQYYGNQVEGMAWGTSAETATGALNLKVEGQWDNSSASSYIEVWSTRLTYYPGS